MCIFLYIMLMTGKGRPVGKANTVGLYAKKN